MDTISHTYKHNVTDSIDKLFDYNLINIFDTIKAGDHKELERLAKAGLDINAPGGSGNTPTHHAAYFGKLKCLEVLAKYTKNNIILSDKWGQTPIDNADRNGHVKCVEFLNKFSQKFAAKPNSEFIQVIHIG